MPPFSPTDVEPELSLIVTPDESSSVTVTDCDGSVRLVVYAPPSPSVTAWVIDTERALPELSTLSLTPTTVTVCAVFQLLVVNVNATDAAAVAADSPGP